MEELKTLRKLLKTLKLVSDKILKRSLRLMEHINDDEDLIEKIIEQKKEISKEEALLLAQNYSLELIKDAENVKKEIDTFMKFTSKGFKINKECSFLTEVWHGDVYDKTEIEGLDALKDDLKYQLENISIDALIEKCIKS